MRQLPPTWADAKSKPRIHKPAPFGALFVALGNRAAIGTSRGFLPS
jgi:hypothetical protein